MGPRIDGDYSGSSSVGSQPNSHVVSPLEPRRPLRFSTLLALDVHDREERFTVYPLLCLAPIATGGHRYHYSARACQARRGQRRRWASGHPGLLPRAIAVEVKSPGASGSAATGQCPNRTPAIGTAMAPGSKNFGPQNCGAVPRTSIPGPGCGEDDRRLLRFSNGF